MSRVDIVEHYWIAHDLKLSTCVQIHFSTTVRNLDGILPNLAELDFLMLNDPSISSCVRDMKRQQPKLCDELSPLKMELEII